MSDYDVIVIGSGAGGGTLAHHLAPSGKRILLLERGGWLPREPQNWRAEDVFVDGRYVSPDTWYYATARRSSHRCTTSSAARPSSTAPRCTGSRARTSASSSTTTGSRRPGRSPTTTWSRTTRRPSSSTRCTARAARTRPSRRRARPYPFPAVSHEPRIQQLSDDLAAAGLHPFHAPCGILLDEGNMPFSQLRALRQLRRLPVPRPRQVRRRGDRGPPGARAPATSRCSPAPRRCGSRPTPPGTAVTGRRGRTSAAARRRSAATSSWSRAAPRTAPSCCSPRPPTPHPPASPTDRTRSGATTCSTTARRCSRCPRSENPTVFQKTLGVNDFYFSGPTTSSFPLGNIQMVGKSQAPMFRGEKPGETRFAPTWSLDQVARHAVDFWLSTEDLPRPTTASRSRATATSRHRLQRHQRGAQGAALPPAQVDARPPRDAPRPPAPAPRLPQEQDPGRRRRPSGGDLPVRHGPATSVLDPDCRAHEVDNLYVVDTSFFPSIGAVNPALTAMANALRVGDHLLGRLDAAAPRPEPVQVA